MNILIIGPSWVGDMMMSNSLFQNLKKIHPESNIHVLAPAWCQDILLKMPEVDKIIHMPLTHGKLNIVARKKIASDLDSEYKQAIVLPNSFKSALVPFFAKIPMRTGWRGEFRYGLINDLRILDKEKYPMMVMRYNALAFPKQQQPPIEELKKPYPHLQVTQDDIKKTTQNLSSIYDFSNEQPFIVICPGAEYGPAKCWPHYHYANLSNLLIQDGYKICILGSQKDSKIAHKIKAEINDKSQCIGLTGKTKLNEVADIMSLSQAVVSNDSGLMHIAAAVNKPLMALYGPTSPEFTPPLSNQAKIIRLIDGYIPIRYADDSPEGYHQSLIDIQPQYVYQELTKMMCSTDD
ncbi:lipopolysaccharide heptosyltransferase II [Neisseriaceae bacterium PsAf]|nr:lipopolysaccharide heptosyltransferase II [Neisseriaceae bacterium PsAf]